MLLSCTLYYMFFLMSNTMVKLGKNQAKTKQQLEPQLFLFENYSLSSFMLPSKTNLKYSKKIAKNQMCLF